MLAEQTLLFLDIQGVLSIPNQPVAQPYAQDVAAPWGAVRGSKELISAIAWAEWIAPLWISSFGSQALLWNDWAKTQRWAIAYPLSDQQSAQAAAAFPSAKQDAKCLAARWCSRRWPHRIVWIEDGFSAIAKAWAAENPKLQLVSTCPFEARSSSDRTGLAEWNIEKIRAALSLDALIPVDP
ncbi:MAG: hypothetical protein IGR80_06880 [Synechococcales cyanobacterium K44_A2020_017]|uniref:hypothetical protein n=1 Tax=Leptolyngbya sp. CCY15150 TaxID=2767772 RepID=UPI00194FCA0E|nr:hypothetical protein [Leptolyngbya sp. CCY15150]MBF2090210.1 hypothetical protein [Synechococcales cyanobacterium K32_A2020_035]MBF2094467.1 hypothetical protein [Synechococcales cyanobacterium K44_A2020_017]